MMYKSNKNRNIKNDKGAISLFVVLAMLFFIVFVISGFTLVARRTQIQAETTTNLKQAYKEDGEAQYDRIIGNPDDVIKIESLNNYNLMATGDNIIVGGVSYIANDAAEYKLAKNINIDLENLDGYKVYSTVADEKANNADGKYRFREYLIEDKLELDDYQIFYYFDSDNDGIEEKYALLVYSSTADTGTPDSYTSTFAKYNRYDKAIHYSIDQKHRFLCYRSDEKAATEPYYTYSKPKMGVNCSTTITTKIPSTYDNVDCFRAPDTDENPATTMETSYFLFVEYTADTAIKGADLGKYGSVGEYVDYGITYTNIATNGSAGISDRTGWRILSNKKNADGTYNISLISAGTPLLYTYAMEDSKVDAKKMVNNLITNFANTKFEMLDKDKKKVSVSGSYFKNTFADSVTTIEYDEFSRVISSTDDYIQYKGGNINAATIKDTDHVEWFDKLSGLLDNNSYYWVPIKYNSTEEKVLYVNDNTTCLALSIVPTKDASVVFGVRPVINLTKGVKIIKGTGTKEDPYVIEKTTEYLKDYGNAGEYVNFDISYTNVTVNSSTPTSLGWRILSNENKVIKLITSGVPLKYNVNPSAPIDLKNVDKNQYTNASGETAKLSDYLSGPYAESVNIFTYDELSHNFIGTEQYIEKTSQTFGENNTISDKYNSVSKLLNKHYINWYSSKKGLINVGADYLVHSRDKLIVATKDEKLVDVYDKNDEIGIRIVSQLKDNIEIIAGNGTQKDPYILAQISEEISKETIKTGVYVTFNDEIKYSNVSKSSLSDSSGDPDSKLTGWRVLSYDEGKELKLISAGVPYYTTLTEHASLSEFVDYIKNFEVGKLEIKDSSGTKLIAKPYDGVAHFKVSALEYKDYVDVKARIVTGEVSKDLLYPGLKYWIADLLEPSNDAVRYANSSIDLKNYTTAESYTSQIKTFGIRPVITIDLEKESQITIEAGSGSEENPYKITIAAKN